MSIPYYIMNNNSKTSILDASNNAYIDDNDLKELLVELLGDNISQNDIQKILDASNDENISEEEFDKIVDEFILNNKLFKN